MTDRELMQRAFIELKDLRDGFNPESTHADEVLDALRARLAEDADVQYEVWQDDEWQAGSNSLEETMHYANQYAHDGAVEVHEVKRRVICKIEN